MRIRLRSLPRLGVTTADAQLRRPTGADSSLTALVYCGTAGQRALPDIRSSTPICSASSAWTRSSSRTAATTSTSKPSSSRGSAATSQARITASSSSPRLGADWVFPTLVQPARLRHLPADRAPSGLDLLGRRHRPARLGPHRASRQTRPGHRQHRAATRDARTGCCSHWPAPVGPSWSHHRAPLVHGLDQPQPLVPSYPVPDPTTRTS